MKDPFSRFGGLSAILVGVLSILYAIFFLVISRRAEYLGMFGSWLILALSGFFTGAAYIAIYQRVKQANEGLALWTLLLGFGSSFATFQHGAYEAQLLSSARSASAVAAQQMPSQVDPAGLATFFVFGIVSFLFGRLIIQSGVLPRTLGYLAMVNAALLVILYLASASGLESLILISGGLTSVIVGPVWWIWLGSALMGQLGAQGMQPQSLKMS